MELHASLKDEGRSHLSIKIPEDINQLQLLFPKDCIVGKVEGVVKLLILWLAGWLSFTVTNVLYS